MFPTLREVLAARACNLSTPSDNPIVKTNPEPEAAPFTPDGILINPATEASLKAYFGVENEDDDERLDSPYVDCQVHEVVETEADVFLFFILYYVTPVRHAFSTSPHVFVRSDHPPPTTTGDDDETSEFRINVGFEMHAGDTSPQWALIGKVAQPGTIEPSDFRSITSGEVEGENGCELGANGRSLCQELRAYAWHYTCPQAFAFDGKYLLILDFLATTQESLQDCKYNVWLIEIKASLNDAQPRMALYRSLRRGVHRLIDERMRASEDSVAMR